MTKKILSFMMAAALVLSAFAGMNLSLTAASALQVLESGDYEYTVNHKNEVKILSYLGNDRQVVIPSEIDGNPVVEIGRYSFNGVERIQDDGIHFENHPNARNNKRIKKITIPSTVRIIGERAFGNMNNLNEVVFSEGLKTIEPYAFVDCSKLESINLPDSLVDFTLLASEGTSIEELVLGTNVEMLCLEDFNGSKVKKITCNADEIYFETVRFEGDSVLEEIVINGNLYDGFTNRKTPIKRIVCNGEATYDAVLEMKAAGFEFCSDVNGNNIVFSKNNEDTKQTYDADGFRYYLNEKSEAVITRYIGGESNVTVPSALGGHKVTAIAPLAFSSLKSTVYSGLVFADDRYIAEDLLVSVTLPDTVKTIGKYAFAQNHSLEKFNIPTGIERIPAECFFNCDSLTNIVLPESVAEIDNMAFRWCESLENVEIPGVVKIGDCAFQKCESLIRIEMKGVEKVGDNAFQLCKALSDVGYSAKLREVGNGSFSDCNLTGTLDISSVVKIGAGAFMDTNIEKVILNDNLERLEYGVFQGCTLLEEINFPSKLVSIGECCFRMTGINKAVFNEGLKEIGALAFDYCKELYILELPDSIEKIDIYAFQDTLIEIVTIPENLRIIGYGAFKNCKELDILHFNAKNCRVDLADQNYQDKTDELGNAPPFIGCKLREIYFGDGVTSIGGYSAPSGTFEDCSLLQSVMIPDSVSVIGTAAFKNCTSLETAIIPGSVTEIADDAFDGCDNLTILCFENSYVHAYAQAQGIKVSTFVVAPIPNQTYTGKGIEPAVSVSFMGDKLDKNIDFGVTYANNINVGEADVTVKGKGDYKNFSNTVKFTIVTKSISSATIAPVADQPYTGSAVTPELTVTDGSTLLREGRDYTASFTDNRKEGTATVKVTGKGNYSGSLSAEFRIVKMSGSQSFFSRMISAISSVFIRIRAAFAGIFN